MWKVSNEFNVGGGGGGGSGGGGGDGGLVEGFYNATETSCSL